MSQWIQTRGEHHSAGFVTLSFCYRNWKQGRHQSYIHYQLLHIAPTATVISLLLSHNHIWEGKWKEGSGLYYSGGAWFPPWGTQHLCEKHPARWTSSWGWPSQSRYMEQWNRFSINRCRWEDNIKMDLTEI